MAVFQDDRADGGTDPIAGNLVNRNGGLAGKHGTSEEHGDTTGRDNLTQYMGDFLLYTATSESSEL